MNNCHTQRANLIHTEIEYEHLARTISLIIDATDRRPIALSVASMIRHIAGLSCPVL